MVIFLSIGLIDKVQEALLQGAYTASTPAAVVYKATWPEQKTVRCTVGTLAQSTKQAGITKTALIVVGISLAAAMPQQTVRPRLYHRIPRGDQTVNCAYLAFTAKGWHWRSSWPKPAPAPSAAAGWAG